MIESLRQQTRLMGLPNIEERVVTYLKQLMVDQQSSKVKLPLKLKDLSSYLGTTPKHYRGRLLNWKRIVNSRVICERSKLFIYN